MERVKTGSVHGRFQPFHNGHLDYVLQAFGLADFLYVGLTQIFRPQANNSALGARNSTSSNPLMFHERAELVTAALVEAGISQNRFVITPFPIENAEHIIEFVPLSAVCFTTIITEWNDEKIRKLELNGFATKTLDVSFPDNVRVTSGTEIRRLIREGEASWARFVPPAVAEMIDRSLKHRFDE